jgi:hypothetical protein
MKDKQLIKRLKEKSNGSESKLSKDIKKKIDILEGNKTVLK